MLNFVSYKDDPGSSQMLCFHSVVLYLYRARVQCHIGKFLFFLILWYKIYIVLFGSIWIDR
jgi:hypothetical protein